MTRRRLTALVAGLGALAVVGILLPLLGSSGQTPAPVQAQPPAASPAPTPTPTPSATTDLPDVPVTDASLRPVVPDPAPVHLRLPSLSVDLPVDPVGVQADGQMEIPPHAERAGWYRFGPAPGAAAGTSVIAAHVDSIASAGLGPFAKLKDLRAGEEVQVDLADGSTVAYVVQEVVEVPKSAVAWPEVFDREGTHRLALITCGGSWQPDVRHYSDNVIVYLGPA